VFSAEKARVRTVKKPTTATTVAKHAKHAKPAAARSGHASTGGKGPKGGASSKHTPAKKHHPAKRKKRTLSPGVAVACCSAEALAASLRLVGAVVSDDDVLALHWRAGGGVDTGVSILAALEAAREFGLAGYRPAKVQLLAPKVASAAAGCKFPLILGLELPGPHAVLAEPDRWWSWGEPYDPAAFPDAVIEEAWAITWTEEGR
jgi:hypothetical protein